MHQPVFTGLVQPTPLHETSFFIDSDVEDTGSETGESFDDLDASPVQSSVESLSEHSHATTSPADLTTPSPQLERASPNLIFRLKSVKGHEAKDGHLFRATLASTQDFDWQSYDPEPEALDEQPPVPEIPAQFKTSPEVKPVPEPETDVLDALLGSAIDKDVPEETSDVANWSSQQVAAWMYNSGFENTVISAFRTHDIHGAVLLDLSFEDLRELDITSFGKRRQIWNEVNALRNEGSPDPLKASSVKNERNCNYLSGYTSPVDRQRRPGFERNGTVTGYRRPGQPAPRQSSPQPLQIPRPHRCSKGEKCPKWKQQQRLLSEIDREHGPYTPPSGKFDFPSPKASPTIPQEFSPMISPTSTVPNAFPFEPTVTSSQVEPIPPVPALPSPDSPTLEPTQPVIDTQHIVQQYFTNNSANTISPETPKWDLFPAPVEKRGSAYPPRQSSLPGTLPNFSERLPKLSIPPSPVHSPSSSDSTIRYGSADPSVSPDVPPSQGVPHRVASPELMPRPLSPDMSLRSRSPSPSLAAIAKQPSTQPFHQLRSPSSEPEMPKTMPAPLFTKEATSGMRPPVLRSAVSTDALTQRRKVNPLPTLKEGSLAANKSTESLAKPLPQAPMHSAPRKMSASAATAVPVDLGRSSSPGLRASLTQRSRSTSPMPQGITANYSRRPGMPPTPRSASASPTPYSAVPPTPRGGNMPPTPQTPATPFVPATPRDSPELSPDQYGSDILQVGWVRQRRARLWRHEWMPVHMRLTKTQISVHATARPDDKPLEIIKMDEYEVAVSHGPGGSKFTSALKNLRGASSKGSGSSVGSVDDSAFTFQLVPTAEMVEAHANHVRASATSSRAGSDEEKRDQEIKAIVEGKSGSAGSKEEMNQKMLKNYYFAVKSRDDRLEWMRHLMMAREGVAKADRQRKQLAKEAADRPVMRSGSF